VKLLDFGLAKLAEYRRTEVTAVNVMFGTPQFMSPEQCRSARDVGPETDVYALGCMAYKLICERLPFEFDNAAELIVAHQTETAPRASSLVASIPPALDELLMAMLAKDPRQRPTLGKIRSTIASARARSSIEVPPPPVASISPHRRVSHAKLVIAAACAGVVLVAVLVAVIVSRDRGVADEPVHHEPEIASTPPPVSTTPTAPPATPNPSIATNTPDASGSAVTTPTIAAKSDNKRSSTGTSPRVATAPITTVVPPVDKPVEKPKVATEVPAPPEKGPGTLSLDSTPPCNIYIDGRSLGLQTPQSAIKLPAGQHQVTLVNADFKITDSFSVEIKTGSIERASKHYEKKTAGPTTINPWAKKKPSPTP